MVEILFILSIEGWNVFFIKSLRLFEKEKVW